LRAPVIVGALATLESEARALLPEAQRDAHRKAKQRQAEDVRMAAVLNREALDPARPSARGVGVERTPVIGGGSLDVGRLRTSRDA